MSLLWNIPTYQQHYYKELCKPDNKGKRELREFLRVGIPFFFSIEDCRDEDLATFLQQYETNAFDDSFVNYLIGTPRSRGDKQRNVENWIRRKLNPPIGEEASIAVVYMIQQLGITVLWKDYAIRLSFTNCLIYATKPEELLIWSDNEEKDIKDTADYIPLIAAHSLWKERSISAVEQCLPYAQSRGVFYDAIMTHLYPTNSPSVICLDYLYANEKKTLWTPLKQNLHELILFHARYPTKTSLTATKIHNHYDNYDIVKTMSQLLKGSPAVVAIAWKLPDLVVCRRALLTTGATESCKDKQRKGQGEILERWKMVAHIIRETDILRGASFGTLTEKMGCVHCKGELLKIWKTKGYKT